MVKLQKLYFILESRSNFICNKQVFIFRRTKAKYHTYYLVELSIKQNSKNLILIYIFQMMLLELNKKGPFKRDVFRAPGHQGNMKKLMHFLQQVNYVSIIIKATSKHNDAKADQLKNCSNLSNCPIQTDQNCQI